MEREILRVLLVEDSVDDAKLLLRELRRGPWEVKELRVQDPEALSEALSMGGWDVVISDYSLPTFSGMEALALLKKRQPEMPFLLVSGTIGEETAVEALQAGADDYLLKDRLARLIPAVQRSLREAEARRGRRRAEEAIIASLAEKELLLKEIHHRVKNNLQVVYSLVSLQSRSVKEPRTLEGLKDLGERVRAMAMVHEKLCDSRDLARIDFAEYIRDLTKSLFHSFGARSGPVQLRVDAEPVPLGIDEAVPCGLIVYELVSNGLKHAFPGGRGGEIRVSLGREGERLRLEVRDDGVGLPPRFNLRDTGSLGLRLVSTLVKQLEGTLSVVAGQGAGFTLLFPAQEAAVKMKRKETVP